MNKIIKEIKGRIGYITVVFLILYPVAFHIVMSDILHREYELISIEALFLYVPYIIAGIYFLRHYNE